MVKVREFPFVPKSNVFLEPGDFFGMPLPNGRWACGRVWGKQLRGRSSFFGSLMDWSDERPPTGDAISEAGLLKMTSHSYRTIADYGLAIDGNVPLDHSLLPLGQRAPGDVYRGGIYSHTYHTNYDPSIPDIPAKSLGGLYAQAVRLFGGETDQEKIRTYLSGISAKHRKR